MAEQKNNRQFKLHILVTEDNKVNQMVARKLLEKLGCDCSIANNGQECIDMLTTHSYDMILMDCMMPIKDGYEATREIRAAGNTHIPIIAFTAKAMDSDHQACLEAGMNDFIDKPINLNQMTSLLDRWSKKLGKD
ncbi:hypothetical protein ACH42_05610 [Endozoicomonas sp. (ex Bugula neritina AB1)]|nr:hypothetical protein ACH42_05610 [Endozoicomonas sp. (ex Bugula neritina AB1)]